MKININVYNYETETLAHITIGDTSTGIKLEKDRDTLESAVIKVVQAINQVLENEQ